MTLGTTYRFKFSSAHFYSQSKWSDEKNRAVFGRCFTPAGHGHNYSLEITIPVSENSPVALKIESAAKAIVQQLDHEHLNFTIDRFQQEVPTTENIAKFIAEKLQSSTEGLGFSLRLYEMDDLWVEIQS